MLQKAALALDADGRLQVRLLTGQESFKTAPLLAARAWAVLPEDAAELPAGTPVRGVPAPPRRSPVRWTAAMKITMQLFGRFREFSAAPRSPWTCPASSTVAEFRAAFDAWAGAHWPGYAPGLLKASAIATESTLLRADSPLPADGRLALLPPVSGG